MTDEEDYEDILDGTVDEAKSKIQELENPDYEGLLEAEIEGKNRKTLRSFLEDQLEEHEREEGAEEERRKILSQGLTPESALIGGLLAGAVIGVLFGSMFLASGTTPKASPAQVQQDVRQLVTSGQGFNGTVDVSTPAMRNNMYFVNITMSQQTPNGTQSQSQGAYVSLDGKLLVPVRRNPLTGQLVSPIPLQQRLEAQQNSPQRGAGRAR